MKKVGIDAIAVAVPEGYLDLADLGAARGVPASKYTEGLGVNKMAIAKAHEDTVALAANAARRALHKAGVSPSTIGLCIIGTETGVDHSKAASAYLHRMLELPQNCRTYETKHACYGGTAGVLTALDWIASGSARGRNALVICSDIARYALHSAGEPTQGAGAVAMIIGENPRLLEIDLGVSGSYSKDVDDFWRPLYSKEAFVDGHFSVQCYLDAIAGAHQSYREVASSVGLDATPVRRVYHVPYGKMAKKAHRHLCTSAGMTDVEADASFANEVSSSLRLPSEIGNIYTGSLYLALASLLHFEADQIEGQRIGLFSYGSGCTAEYFSGRVVEGAAAFVQTLEIAQPLANRRRYTIAEYETIRRADNEIDNRPVESHNFPPFAFVGVEQDRRVYQPA